VACSGSFFGGKLFSTQHWRQSTSFRPKLILIGGTSVPIPSNDRKSVRGLCSRPAAWLAPSLVAASRSFGALGFFTQSAAHAGAAPIRRPSS
jgi:hypothetical protein